MSQLSATKHDTVLAPGSEYGASFSSSSHETLESRPPLTPENLLTALTLFRAQDPDLSMAVMVTFLTLHSLQSKSETGEVPIKDLQKATGLSMSAANRALTYLGDRHWSKSSSKGGLELVSQRVDAEDRRARLACITPKGVALLRTLEGIR